MKREPGLSEKDAYQRGAAAERERCAKIAERISQEHCEGDGGEIYICRKIADEIRKTER